VASGKARPPMVESLTGGGSRWLVLAEQTARRPDMSAIRAVWCRVELYSVNIL